jgi:hypothetical protein
MSTSGHLRARRRTSRGLAGSELVVGLGHHRAVAGLRCPIPTGTLQSNGFSGSRRRPEGRSSSSFHRKMPSQARGLSAPTRGSVEGWRAGLGRTGLLPLASPATSFRKSRSLISITRSAGREKKKQHARAERLRDHKIEDRLFLGLMIGGSTGLASLSLFFRIKSTSKALAVGCG